MVIARDSAGFFKLYGFNSDLANLNLELGNRGDSLTLKDSSGTEIDFISWENHTSGWNITATRGNSISRTSTVDTDTVNDWVVISNDGNPGQ